jgi:hypothetical protein
MYIQHDAKFPKLKPFTDTGPHMGCSSVRQIHNVMKEHLLETLTP